MVWSGLVWLMSSLVSLKYLLDFHWYTNSSCFELFAFEFDLDLPSAGQ